MRTLALALLVALAPIAAAQPAPTDAKAARDHFKAGAALIKQQRFDAAIKELEAAYDLDPQPEHLYNLGVAHHLRGDDAIAVEYYRLFLLDAAPGSKEARDAASFRVSLGKKIDDARAAKIHSELAAAQVQASQSGEATVEMILYAQYTADAEATEHRLAVIDEQAAATETERVEMQKRAREVRSKTKATVDLARAWEHHARIAPSGGGRGQRIVGAVFLALGAAGLTMGMHDKLTADDLPVTNHADLYLASGAASFLIGLIVALNGTARASHPRSADTFTHLQLAPTLGPGGGGFSLQAAF